MNISIMATASEINVVGDDVFVFNPITGWRYLYPHEIRKIKLEWSVICEDSYDKKLKEYGFK